MGTPILKAAGRNAAAADQRIRFSPRSFLWKPLGWYMRRERQVECFAKLKDTKLFDTIVS